MRTLLLTILVLFWAVVTPASAASPYDPDGPYAVETTDVIWTDAARQRALPLRVRMPIAPGARPVVIFSHGLGGQRRQRTRLGRTLGELRLRGDPSAAPRQ